MNGRLFTGTNRCIVKVYRGASNLYRIFIIEILVARVTIEHNSLVFFIKLLEILGKFRSLKSSINPACKIKELKVPTLLHQLHDLKFNLPYTERQN